MQEATIINSQQQLAAWWMDIHKQDNQTHILQAEWRPERRFCNPGSLWQKFPSEEDGNLRASIRCVYANAGPKYIQGAPFYVLLLNTEPAEAPKAKNKLESARRE